MKYALNSFQITRWILRRQVNSDHSKLISLHYYQLHKFVYLSELLNVKSFLNGLYLLLSCLNSFEHTNDRRDIKLIHEYYFSLIVYLKLLNKFECLTNITIKNLFNRLISLNLNYNYLIINNDQFREYLIDLKLNIESLKQKITCNTAQYTMSDHLKMKFQDYILSEMIHHLLSLKSIVGNKNKKNRFEGLKLLYIQLIKSSNDDSTLSLNEASDNCDDSTNKIRMQFVLLQFLNMIYYWKFKKFSYKLSDTSKLMNVKKNYESNDR